MTLNKENHIKPYCINIEDTKDDNKALLTHYIHDKKKNDTYKKKAIQYVKQTLVEEHDDIYQIDTVAEEALQQLIFTRNKEQIPFSSPKKPKFTFIDLFAGIGGFRLALQNTGGQCLYSSEWNPFAKKTYEANFGDYPFGDITLEETKKFIPKNFDILCGGFPCQAFSVAGYQKGFRDTRGTLFFDIEKILESRKPKAFFLENVKNLAQHDKGATLATILYTLEKKLGYKVFHKVLNSMEYANIPQNRERIFIIGFDPERVTHWNKFVFPEPIKLTKTIRDLIFSEKQADKYYYKKEHMYYSRLKETMQSWDTVYQWRRVYVRENKSNVCPTLTANMGTGGHNVPIILDKYGIRKLTPKECFRFQGYPENFVLPNIADSKLYTQAGNSVTVPLIERIAKNITTIIKQK